jgi:hypothetical protein
MSIHEKHFTWEPYKFELERARLLGNSVYFTRHLDRYAKSLAWGAAIAGVIGIIGYTLKDWIAALFSIP